MTGRPIQSKVMCRQRKWQMAVGGCDDGDSGGGRGGQAESVEQMDEVSLKLPTDRRGPQQPGRLSPRWRRRGRHDVSTYVMDYQQIYLADYNSYAWGHSSKR